MIGIIGQLGRVGVLGGSEDYTGAPYFSGMASARLGCDMVSKRISLTSPFFRFSNHVSTRGCDLILGRQLMNTRIPLKYANMHDENVELGNLVG